jgi:preprotein translocase subunit SecD
VSQKRQNLSILGLLILLLIGCAALALVRDFRLGLDLRGGVEVVLDARPLPNQTITQADLDTSTSILRRRIDPDGTLSPTITISNTPGNYNLCYLADSTNVVIESDKTNNTLCIPVTIRPIRLEDETLLVEFHQSLSTATVHSRYWHVMNVGQRTNHERLVRVCDTDFDREVAIVAER